MSASLALVAARHSAPRRGPTGPPPAPERHSPGASSAAQAPAAGSNGAPLSRGPGAEPAAAGGASSSGQAGGGDSAGGLRGAGRPWEGWEDPRAVGGPGGRQGLRRLLGRMVRGGAGGKDELGLTGKLRRRRLQLWGAMVHGGVYPSTLHVQVHFTCCEMLCSCFFNSKQRFMFVNSPRVVRA